MTDSKITKKHHPSGSMARRILLVAILLLVVPLFLQSLFLYDQEYKDKVQSVREELTLLGGERVNFLKAMISIAHVKRFYIEEVPLPEGVKDQFFLVSKKRQALVIGKRQSDKTAEILPIPFDLIGKDIPSIYPIRLSLIDQTGQAVWENREFDPDAELIDVTVPILDSGLSFELAIETKMVRSLQMSTYYFKMATLLVFIGLIGGGCVSLLTLRVSRALNQLCRTMERVSEGAIHSRFTPDPLGFEINQLGLQLNDTLDQLELRTGEVSQERIAREKLAEELRIGHEIQKQLVPPQSFRVVGLDIATGYFSAKEVNGDFYDLIQLEDGQLLIVVCDTAGKGISACLFSLGLRSVIRSLASVTSDLAELVRKANDIYWVDARATSMFSTLWIGIYDPANAQLVYCSQGHPPALLRRGDKCSELWTTGIALGAQQIDEIDIKKKKLLFGDLLCIYTDGVTEAHNKDNQLFGKGRLIEVVMGGKKSRSQRVVDRVMEEIKEFSEGTLQHDDITVLVIQL